MHKGFDGIEKAVREVEDKVDAVGQVRILYVSFGLVNLTDGVRRWSILVGTALACTCPLN